MCRTSLRIIVALALALLAHVAVASPPATPWLPRAPGTALRVLVWNVDRAFARENDGFRRVLNAVDADVLVLDEMDPATDATQVAAGLPERDGGWHVLVGEGGGPHERASVAARVPVRRAAVFDGLAYPRAKYDDWLAGTPPDRVARRRAALDAGVTTVGGILDLDGRRVLVVGLDLRCCGDGADSPEEERRRFEAGAIRGAIDAAGPVDAIVVGGDFNPIAGPAPVDIVARGAPALAPVRALHADGATEWTWDGTGTPYASGRLDYVLHSDALVVLQARVLDTAALADAGARALDKAPGLPRTLSPHRPIVVDFAWREGR
jgi:hypothetical protein